MMTFVGIVFMVLWGLACLVWAVLSIPGGLMANDSGAFSTDKQMVMLAGLALGQLVVLAAGVPGGMAFFTPETRSSLIWWAVILAAVGVVLQVASVAWFFAFGQK